MKLLLIFTLAALLVGCVKIAPDESAPEKADPVTEASPPEETSSAEETKPSDETLPPKTEPGIPEAAERPDITEFSSAYDIFYLSQTPPVENGEPADTYTALAALAFDFSAYPDWWANNYSSTAVSYTDIPVNINSIEYLRMVSDRVVYPFDPDKFTSPMGHTADGMPYVWETRHYSPTMIAETGTEYSTWIQLNETAMAHLSFYGYSIDENFENDILLPLLDTCRTWTPCTPLEIRFTTNSTYQDDDSPDYHISLELPVQWQWNNSSVADDMERMYTGRYSIKRMEFHPVTYPEVFKGYEQLQSQGIPDPITGTTDKGLPYEIYSYASRSEAEPLGVTWYFVNIAFDGRFIPLSFLTFEDDPADYFETVTLPVIKSVHIEEAE